MSPVSQNYADVIARAVTLAYLARAVVCPATGGAQLPITITLLGRPHDTDRRVTVRREEGSDEPEHTSEWTGSLEEWQAAIRRTLAEALS